jgi:hypothetical protein
MYVDPGYIVEHGAPLLDDPEIALSRSWLLSTLVTASGILGNEQKLRDLLALEPGSATDDERLLRTIEPFWLSVFGRHDEAARLFEKVMPIPETEPGPHRFGASFDSQALPALLRTYRATGRGTEADELARRFLAKYRAGRPPNPDEREYGYWVRDAALAANEGLRDEAVRCLQQAMNWYDTPVGFVPSLPWFRSLEGHSGYDALRQELARRVSKAREAMLALDASLLPSAKQPQSVPGRPAGSPVRDGG